jgi:hypothetical protein
VGVVEEVWIVALLPDQDQMSGGHENSHERAALGRTRKGVRTDAKPPAPVAAFVVSPEAFVLGQVLFGEDSPARLDPALLHFVRLPAQAGVIGQSRTGVRAVRSAAAVGPGGARVIRASPGPHLVTSPALVPFFFVASGVKFNLAALFA